MRSDRELTIQAHSLVREANAIHITSRRNKERPGEFMAKHGIKYDVDQMTSKHFDHNDIIHSVKTKSEKMIDRLKRPH